MERLCYMQAAQLYFTKLAPEGEEAAESSKQENEQGRDALEHPASLFAVQL